MSQASTLKSPAITGLDTTPVSPSTTGEGAPAYARVNDGFVTCLTADTTASLYKLVRIPSNSKLKNLYLNTDALGASTTLNVGLYYSDSTVDGTPPAVQGTVINATLFGSALAATSAQVDTDISPNISLRSTPLWSVAGLAADPGGYFDVVAAPAVSVVAGGKVGAEVIYAD